MEEWVRERAPQLLEGVVIRGGSGDLMTETCLLHGLLASGSPFLDMYLYASPSNNLLMSNVSVL